MYFRFYIACCIILFLIHCTQAEEDFEEDEQSELNKDETESKLKNDHRINKGEKVKSIFNKSINNMIFIELSKGKKSKNKDDKDLQLESKCNEYKAIQRVTASTMIKYERENFYYFKCVSDCAEIMSKDTDIYLPVFSLDFINCNIKSLQMFSACESRFKNLTLVKIQGKPYYFSVDTKLSWHGAAQWCRSRGLRLAEIESKTKEQDLFQFVKTNADMKRQLASLKLWIAASNIGRINNKIYWSESGKDFDLKLSQINKYNCILLSGWLDMSTVWNSRDCKEKNSFLCEVPSLCYKERCFIPFNSSYPVESCKIQSCSTYNKCVPKSKFFSEDGRLQVTPDMGVTVTTCGKQYVFSSVEKSFSDAYKMCCDLGMKLINLKTLNDMECIRKLFTDTGVQPKITAFWSSGYDKLCRATPESYIWCSTNEKFTSQVPWLPDQPTKQSNVENCVSLYLSPRASGLLNRNCINAIRFICEGNSTGENMSKSKLNEIMTTLTNINSTTRIVSKIEPFVKTGMMGAVGIKSMKDLDKVCPLLWCKEDEGVYNENNEITVNSSIGSMVKVCGKTYMLSKVLTTSTTIWPKCCKLGMYVASVNSREELNCLLAWYKGENRRSYTFLINSFDITLNRTFGTCDENQALVPEDLWFPGEPNNLAGMDINTMLYLSASNVGGLIDVPGTELHRYICQVPETRRKWRRHHKSKIEVTQRTLTEVGDDD